MKKQYISPKISCISSECEQLMAGSGELDKYSSTPKIDLSNPATESEVTSKSHNSWDGMWDDDAE